MAQHIENLNKDHLDTSAHLLVSVFNTEPWNANYSFDTARKGLTRLVMRSRSEASACSSLSASRSDSVEAASDSLMTIGYCR